MKPQTLKDFWNEHRIVLIILLLVIGLIFIIFLISLGINENERRCNVPYADRQYYKDLIYDYKWSAKAVNAVACADYPECNCKKILNQIWYNK